MRRRAHPSSRAHHDLAWHDRTLEGHLEREQMDDEVVQCREDARGELRLAASSPRGQVQDPIGLTVMTRSGPS